MIRLDKYLSNLQFGSRSQIKIDIKKGAVKVNGVTAVNGDQKIDELHDQITYKDHLCSYEKFVYFMLNKPTDCVSATKDNVSETVMAILKEEARDDLFPVGRLDKDTEGLLLITNDGELAHALLSPKKHVAKTYYAALRTPLSGEDIAHLEEGVDIGEKNLTLPAKIKILEDTAIEITISEGKFHQIKRMLHAVDNEVLSLKRLAMGSLKLDETLKPGEFRRLSETEIMDLKENK